MLFSSYDENVFFCRYRVEMNLNYNDLKRGKKYVI